MTGRGRRARNGDDRHLLLFGIITFLNLLLSIAIRVSDRKLAISAIQNDDELSVLYKGKKTTKTL